MIRPMMRRFSLPRVIYQTARVSQSQYLVTFNDAKTFDLTATCCWLPFTIEPHCLLSKGLHELLLLEWELQQSVEGSQQKPQTRKGDGRSTTSCHNNYLFLQKKQTTIRLMHRYTYTHILNDIWYYCLQRCVQLSVHFSQMVPRNWYLRLPVMKSCWLRSWSPQLLSNGSSKIVEYPHQWSTRFRPADRTWTFGCQVWGCQFLGEDHWISRPDPSRMTWVDRNRPGFRAWWRVCEGYAFIIAKMEQESQSQPESQPKETRSQQSCREAQVLQLQEFWEISQGSLNYHNLVEITHLGGMNETLQIYGKSEGFPLS